MSARVKAIVNQKGGTAKTATCENLGVAYHRKGKKVLLIDMDPQASLTIALGYSYPDDLSHTIDVLMQEALAKRLYKVEDYIHSTEEDVDLIPSCIRLSVIEFQLAKEMNKYVLKEIISQVKDQYDDIFIDCGPSLGVLTLNVLNSANSVVIPAQPSYLSMKGLELLLMTIASIQKGSNPDLKIDGILFTLVEYTTNYAKDSMANVRKMWGNKINIFDIEIPKSVRGAEMSSEGVSIFTHDPRGKLARAYRNLCEEMMKNE